MEVNTTSLNPESRFKDGTARSAPRVPRAKWEEHKELLCSLYQKKTISEIIIFMRSEHNFVANAAQLGRQLRDWGVYKYNSKNRPSNPAPLDIDHQKNSETVPQALHQGALKNTTVQHLPDTKTLASAPHIAHSSLDSDTDLVTIQANQAYATTCNEKVVAWCMSKILQTYDEAIVRVSQNLDDGILDKQVLEIWLRRWPEGLHIYYFGGLNRFGTAYARGDSRIQEELIHILIEIRKHVLSSLQSTCAKDVRLDYSALWSELVENVEWAISCLKRFSHRLSEIEGVEAAAVAATCNNRLVQPMPSLISTGRAPDTLGHVDDWRESGSKTTGESDLSISAQGCQTPGGNASAAALIMPAVVEESKQGALSDTDLDRFSEMSVTSSTISGFASFQSLSRRIKDRQRTEKSSDRNPTDDIPSNAMHWEKSSSRSLQLFGQISDTSSVGSSTKTDNMS